MSKCYNEYLTSTGNEHHQEGMSRINKKCETLIKILNKVIPLKIFSVVLVAYGCHYKASQTEWLKTNSVVALEATSLKSRCWQGPMSLLG